MTLPTETVKALESLVYADVEDLVILHGEENRRSILSTKAMLMELGTEHLEWLKPILAEIWAEGYAQGVHDERQAAEVNIPEYRIPNRQNPYREA